MHIEKSMNEPTKSSEVSERLRLLVDDRYPKRGRFRVLEEASGITEYRWKNFYYRKQDAAEDMLDFWCSQYPYDINWLQTGRTTNTESGYPFSTKPPVKHAAETVADRLAWVISEWAAGSGEMLFQYLEEKSQGTISATEWAKVILKTAIPSADMVAVVCNARPHFTEWVVLGRVGKEVLQVDPSDTESIASWMESGGGYWKKILDPNLQVESNSQSSTDAI